MSETRVCGIAKTKGTVGGRARIDGTRIPVWAVVEAFLAGMSVQEISVNYVRQLTVEQVESALRYALNNLKEILVDIRENRHA